MIILKKLSLLLMIILYLGAGVNHFWHPSGYYSIIPPYLPNPFLINIAAGISELILGTLLIFSRTRKLAAYAVILMLIAFIPAHIYMIQAGGCMPVLDLAHPANICIPAWVAWVRLFPLQFILMAWAWWVRKM